VSDFDLSRPVLDRLRDAADIVAVIASYLTLKKQGRNWMGLCPFHGEKTPSFAVSREKGTFYCFGCKRGGDVIDFVMEIERLSFPDAVERLAHQFGVELPAASPASRRRREERDVLAEALEAAQAMFVKRVGDDRPRAFLDARGVPQQLALEFGLGYAPDEWRLLYDHLHHRYSERVLEAAGLVVRGETGRLWDRFRNRITIPIRDSRGALVGFGGRALGDDHPKYLNSPETPLFSKSRLLFAVDRAQRAFAEAGRAVVVEGYFDCIALHHAGLAETVATLGTSLTEQHAHELARKAGRVVVCYDGDAAGRQAALGAVRTLLAADVDVAVLLLPDGADPDDLVRREGGDGFRARLDGALSVTDFLVAQMGSARSERRQQAGVAAEILDACPDPARRFLLKEALAFASGVPLEALGPSDPARSLRPDGGPVELPPPGEMALLRYLCVDASPEQRRTIVDALPLDLLGHASTRAIVTALRARTAAGLPLEISALTSDIEERETRRLLAALEFEAPPVTQERLGAVTRELWERQRQRRLADLTRAITAAEKEGSHEQVARLLAEKSRLLKERAPFAG